mmetsp:Transcript_37015/g.118669  ORF Transcript_37015/g.118669 Transcript_37015/m.118669 type:complete len:272 (-) Transcript_37015:260-1075(-)
MKGTSQMVEEEPAAATPTTKKMRLPTGLREQVKVLMLSSSMALIFVTLLLTNVTRAELKEADELNCLGAKEHKCDRSDKWQWGNQQTFGVVWSYRLLGSGLLSLTFFALALFLALALYMSLCIGMNYDHDSKSMGFYFFLHDLFTFAALVCFFVGLSYFLFAVQALVHVKFPSYKPRKFWDGTKIVDGDAEFDEDRDDPYDGTHNPPYNRFAAIVAWFTFALGLSTLLIFMGIAKLPMLATSAIKSGKKKTTAQQEDTDPPPQESSGEAAA